MNLYFFMSSVIVSKEFSSVEAITKTMLLRLRLQSVLPLITRTDDRPVFPVIINGLLAVFLYVFPLSKTKEPRIIFNSLKKT